MARGKLSELGAELVDLRGAFESRFKDYECLRDAKQYAGAVIMGLFAVEILLKCLICKNIREEKLPRVFEEHDLQGLLIIAGLRCELENFPNKSLQLSWTVLQGWGEKSIRARYLPDVQAMDPLEWAFFSTAFEDQICGVVPWLMQRL